MMILEESNDRLLRSLEDKQLVPLQHFPGQVRGNRLRGDKTGVAAGGII
jgi:hypothetical protein